MKPAETAKPTLREAIAALLTNNRIRCLDAWAIAEKLGLKKLNVANACEGLKIKVCDCQIGSFK